MRDFHLSDEAWERAAKELKAAGRTPNLGHRQTIEFYCAWYVLQRSAGKKGHPTPAKHAAQWRALVSAVDGLTDAITDLDGSGAAELQILEIFPGGHEVISAVKDRLPALRDMANIVAEVESRAPRIPAKTDPARDQLASSLISFWFDGITGGATKDGPAARFLSATLSEVLAAVQEPRPSPDALRGLLRKWGGELNRQQ